MKNHYSDSWSLYKAQSGAFKEDFEYYLKLCLGRKTLEIFAGYGRLSNYLISNGVDLETVELEPKFARYINLPAERNHIGDVLAFESKFRYERIIGAYNSFCLLLSNEEIEAFFRTMSALLEPGGLLSLSYYPLDSWVDQPETSIECDGVVYKYQPRFDLTRIQENIAIWVDEFTNKSDTHVFRYPTRIYRDDKALTIFAEKSGLRFSETIVNYNKNIENDKWIEYVFFKE